MPATLKAPGISIHYQFSTRDQLFQKFSISALTPSIQTKHIGHFHEKDIIRAILK